MTHPIQRALLSVSDKTGVVELARFLADSKVELLSTGGTANLLREAGLAVRDVSEVTGFPEMMDGRVKTLHPGVHGGILAVRSDAAHMAAANTHGIGMIDLVVINLYPFEATIAKGASYDEAVEMIDIGGPAMIRAAAKNHADVTVVVDPADYAGLTQELRENGLNVSELARKRLAAKALARTGAYDSAIAQWFGGQLDAWPASFHNATMRQHLRYGENPHQKAAFYARAHAPEGLATAEQWQGKELSYNNLHDTDAAFQLVAEFDAPAIAIIKHANPCGVAIGEDLTDAFAKAKACDPVSAFGGILAANRPIDAALVEAIGSLFLEVIIAPGIAPEAATMLSAKKNLRVLVTNGMPARDRKEWQVKSVLGGYLVQEEDANDLRQLTLTTVTQKQPDAAQERDLRFAFAVCRHVKSNAIVLAKGGATIGIGAGQMSRVDSVRLACDKAAAAGLSTQGTVLASDAFFPFDDNVHLAAKHGIAALIQPGGSMRDGEVIAAADQHGMVMVTTGERHFRH